MHLSRLAEDLIILNSDAYQLVSFNDKMLTGSSIMPQKRTLTLQNLLEEDWNKLWKIKFYSNDYERTSNFIL